MPRKGKAEDGHIPAQKLMENILGRRFIDGEIPQKELPGVPFGTLLGRLGKVFFFIGDRKQVVMPSSGYLIWLSTITLFAATIAAVVSISLYR
nr:hypothetical protein [Desulfobacterales bacterium]